MNNKSTIRIYNDGKTIRATGDAANEMFKAMSQKNICKFPIMEKGYHHSGGPFGSVHDSYHTVTTRASNGFQQVVLKTVDAGEQNESLCWEIIRLVNSRDEIFQALKAAVDTMASQADHETNCATNADQEHAESYGCTCGLFNQINQTQDLLNRLTGEKK